MGIFNRKKKAEVSDEKERLDKNLREDLSKAYDELMTGGKDDENMENRESDKPHIAEGSFEAELIKAKIRDFKEKKTNETLTEVFKFISGKQFCIPSVSNMKHPFENIDGKLTLKKGASLNPALLQANGKTYLPIFTDEKSMKQKSPSGIVLKYPFEHCVGIVYNKKNPITAIVINPFTENFIIGEELLNAVFKKIDEK